MLDHDWTLGLSTSAKYVIHLHPDACSVVKSPHLERSLDVKAWSPSTSSSNFDTYTLCIFALQLHQDLPREVANVRAADQGARRETGWLYVIRWTSCLLWYFDIKLIPPAVLSERDN